MVTVPPQALINMGAVNDVWENRCFGGPTMIPSQFREPIRLALLELIEVRSGKPPGPILRKSFPAQVGEFARLEIWLLRMREIASEF